MDLQWLFLNKQLDSQPSEYITAHIFFQFAALSLIQLEDIFKQLTSVKWFQGDFETHLF